ncbi:DUF1660 family phage protein [Ralstonia holmesii]
MKRILCLLLGHKFEEVSRVESRYDVTVVRYQCTRCLQHERTDLQ